MTLLQDCGHPKPAQCFLAIGADDGLDQQGHQCSLPAIAMRLDECLRVRTGLRVVAHGGATVSGRMGPAFLPSGCTENAGGARSPISYLSPTSRQLFSLTSTSNFFAAALIRFHAASRSSSETSFT